MAVAWVDSAKTRFWGKLAELLRPRLDFEEDLKTYKEIKSEGILPEVGFSKIQVAFGESVANRDRAMYYAKELGYDKVI